MSTKFSRRDFIKSSSTTAAGLFLSTEINGREKNNVNYIKENPRKTPIIGEYDICVVGGSCTGVFAAVSAARLGARVVIIENNGFFGGVATASLVNVWHSIYDTSGDKQIISGLTMEMIERLKKKNGVKITGIPSSYFQMNTYELIIELDKLIQEEKVKPFLHTLFVSPIMEEKKVSAVIVEDKSGRRAIKASYFIDATGDGDLVHRMGFLTYKRPYIQPPTMCAIIRGLDEIKSNVPDFSINKAVFDANNPNALESGFLWTCDVPDSKDDTMVAGTRVFGADCSDAEQLTNASIEGRRQVRAICDTLRNSYEDNTTGPLVSLPAKIGIRESRHAKCLHTLSEKEVLNGVRFNDAVANGSYRVDVHLSNNNGLIFRDLDGTEIHAMADGTSKKTRWREETAENPTFYQVPYHSLVPEDSENVLVAGRIIDADEGAFGAVRVMVNCNQMGQAVGAASYLALNAGLSIADVDTDKLRETLKRQGALII